MNFVRSIGAVVDGGISQLRSLAGRSPCLPCWKEPDEDSVGASTSNVIYLGTLPKVDIGPSPQAVRQQVVSKADCERVVKECYARVMDSVEGIDAEVLNGGDPSKAAEWLSRDLQVFAERFPLYKKDAERLRASLRLFQQRSREVSNAPATDSKRTDRVLEAIWRDIGSLQTGRSLILHGGYHSANTGHSLLYAVKRIQQDAFEVHVINTGEGLTKYHQQTGSGGKGWREIVYKDLSYADLSKPALWTLLEPRFSGHSGGRSFSIDDVYRRAQQVLAKTGGANVIQGREYGEQRKGSCWYKCVTAWLHGEMEEKAYRRFKAIFTSGLMEDLRRVEGMPGLGKLEFVHDSKVERLEGLLLGPAPYLAKDKSKQSVGGADLVSAMRVAGEAILQKRMNKVPS